ncbi:MAG: fibro-slime domain-containing protein [Chitinispirillia bacterium]|nr:fibro-slime domain-containing protein [Chitinispirillia bacterium]
MKTRRAVSAQKLVIGLLCLAFGGLVFNAYGQADELPPTMVVNVKLYDFRADRSNPEFEQPHDGRRLHDWMPGLNIQGLHEGRNVAWGMLDSLLDVDFKPVLGPRPYMNHGVRFWFRNSNNLPSYRMADSIRIVDGVERGYLERFRPFYMYRRYEERADGDGGGRDGERGRYLAFPPMPRAPMVNGSNSGGLILSGGNADNRGGHNATLGRLAQNNEWNSTFLSNANPVVGGNMITAYTGANIPQSGYTGGRVPYVYANSDPNTLLPLRDGSNFTMIGTAGSTRAARLNFGSRTDNFDYTIDSAFSNIVIDTALTFSRVGTTRTYRFEESSFLPLRDRGFQAPGLRDQFGTWQSHGGEWDRRGNFSFGMEMVWEFRMENGLEFNFRGDDDVWVFVNEKLALDLGGIHQPAPGRIRLDQLRSSHNLVNGETYYLRMFYVERHTTGSSIWIESNILATSPREFNIVMESDTIPAGVPTVAVADVKFEDGGTPTGMYFWTAVDVTPGIAASERNLTAAAGGVAGQNLLSITAMNGEPISPTMPTSADSILIRAEKAYTTIQLTGRFVGTGLTQGSADTTVIIFIGPGAPHRVVIEASNDSSRTLPGGLSALRSASPIDTVRITAGMEFNNQFFGIVRDEFNNWIQPAAPFPGMGNPPYNGTATWTLATRTGQPNWQNMASIPTDWTGVNRARGQGRVNKSDPVTPGLADLRLAYRITSGTFTGNFNAETILSVAGYSELAVRVGVWLNGVVGGTFVTYAYSPSTPIADRVPVTDITQIPPMNIVAGGDTTLYVQVLRSDRAADDPNRWVTADVNWSWVQNTAHVDSPATSIFTTPAPGAASSARVVVGSASPLDRTTGNPIPGTITVNLTGNSSEYATLPVISTLGSPASMRLYNGAQLTTAAAPVPAHLYPPAITVLAGDTVSIVPKLFANNSTNINMWIRKTLDMTGNPRNPAYDTDNFRWGFTANSPINDGTRIHTSGAGNSNQTAINGRDSIGFSSTVAFQTYVIWGSYTVGSGVGARVISCTLSITVQPDYRNPRLIIEGSPVNTNDMTEMTQARKLDRVTFGSDEIATDPLVLKPIYAVLRDQWGNFIGYAGAAPTYTGQTPVPYPTWELAPLAFPVGPISVTAGTRADTTNGRGWVNPNRVSTAPITVTANSGGPLLRDAVQVVLLAYTYDNLVVAIRLPGGETCNPVTDTWCRTIVDDNGNTVPDQFYRIFTGTDTLKITSNDDVTFYVLGRISQQDASGTAGQLDGKWEPITAGWGTSLPGILGNPPGNAGSWPVSPTGAAVSGGTVTASTTVGGNPLTGSLNIVIAVGPPTGVTLEILNRDNLRAGEEIKAVVRYTNRAGVITQWDPAWGTGAHFGGTLGITGNHVPKVGDNNLGYSGMTGSLGTNPEWFGILPNDNNATLNLNREIEINTGLEAGIKVTGLDTVTFIIYLASDAHQIRLYHPNAGFGGADGYVTVLTDRFTVRAGALADIAIEGTGHDPARGRIYVTDTDGRIISVDYSQERGAQDILTAIGYDAFGNRIGNVGGDWTTAGGIPAINRSTCVDQILYDSRQADEAGEGTITVVAVDSATCIPVVGADGRPITTTITVRIVDVVISVGIARTLDIGNAFGGVAANGYIDHIELTFSKPVSLLDEGAKLAELIVSNTNPRFDLRGVGITDMPVGASNVWRVAVEEDTTTILQTGIIPTSVTIPAGLFSEVPSTILRANATPQSVFDGIAPVIATAQKFFGARESDPDRLDVTLSEPVDAAFFTGLTSNDLFNIWETAPVAGKRRLAKAASADERCGNRTILPDELAKAPDQSVQVLNGGRTLRFFLGAGPDKIDLTTRHFINIRTLPDARIRDEAAAVPGVPNSGSNVQDVYCNRLVPITYGNNPPQVAKAIPNPSTPDVSRVPAGVLRPTHDPTAVNDIRNGIAGGSVVRVPIYIPDGTKGEKQGVRCQIKVYDLVGNLVHAARTSDLLGESAKAPLSPDFGTQGGQFMDIDLYWNGYNSKKMKVSPGTYRLIVQFDYVDPELQRRFRGRNKFTASVGVSK